jgi:hypothetical protein
MQKVPGEIHNIFSIFLLSQMQAKKISRLMIQPHVGAILMCEQPPMFDTNIHSIVRQQPEIDQVKQY